MARNEGIGRTSGAIVVGLLLLLALSGCGGSSSAAPATSMVRVRPTAESGAYTLEMDAAVKALRDSLNRLSVLFSDPRYFDDAWKSEAVNLATQVELGYRKLEGLTPPNQEQKQYTETVRAVKECQILTAYVFQGINNLDKAPFDEVKERVNFCRTGLDVATRAPGSQEAQSQPPGIAAARQEIRATVRRDANVRGGPGTSYPRVATARPGDAFTITGRTARNDWFRISSERVNNAWIAAFLVQADGDLNSVPIVNPANP